MTAKSDTFDVAIDNYSEAAKSASKSKKIGKAALVGFGAVAAGGLFTASQAEADVIYSGVVNTGIFLPTWGDPATNSIMTKTFYSTGGAIAFGIGGNQRGTGNPVGQTDILWAVGAGYAGLGGSGGIIADAASFPASVVPLQYSELVGDRGTPGSLAWAAAGLPGTLRFDPFGMGSTGSADGYIGFTFNNGLTGWAFVQLTSNGGEPVSINVVDWAYDNTTGNQIHVGDRGDAVPEPTGLAALAMLALGAVGIRRRKSLAT